VSFLIGSGPGEAQSSESSSKEEAETVKVGETFNVALNASHAKRQHLVARKLPCAAA
jgi:hypothetical protein